MLWYWQRAQKWNVWCSTHPDPHLSFPLKYSFVLCGIGPPCWLSGKETACQCRRHGFDPWVGKIYWSRKWWPTPVFLPGKSHRERSLAVKPTVHGLAKEYTNEQINNIQGPAMIFRPLEHLSLDHFQFSSVALSCPTLCDPMNCSTPGSFAHGILQAGILE